MTSLKEFDLENFNFHLDKSRIAQFPVKKRGDARLLIYYREKNKIIHTKFNELEKFLNVDDILVINTSKVYKARIFGYKQTGGKVEFLLVRRTGERIWDSLIKARKKLSEGQEIIINHNNSLQATIGRMNKDGSFKIEFNKNIGYKELESIGKMPLPPYIKREAENFDDEYYQTVYSSLPGSVAAPTAGLHFSKKHIDKLECKGIKFARVSLDISWHTFRPVKSRDIRKHDIHEEHYNVSEETKNIINKKKGQIIGVGTTSVRVLESISDEMGKIKNGNGNTRIYIYPGYKFKVTNGILTNFHLPKSSLFIMISAFTGIKELKKIYSEAIKSDYRFFSYGDAMLIL